MKAITIKQPWASLIVEARQDNILLGIKDVENRTWPTKLRGRVLVHASFNPVKGLPCEILTPLQYAEVFTANKLDSLVGNNGVIIGSIEIVDCVINHESIWAEKSEKCPFRTCEACDENKHRCIYYNKPIYNWVLANPIKFPVPIPAKGKLSFWDYPNIVYEQGEKDGLPLHHFSFLSDKLPK